MSMTVLVTGATAGIGRDLALRLARAGYRVFATGRKASVLDDLAKEAAGLKLETVLLDVNDARSIAAAKSIVDEHTQGYGIDVLVNNAGYGQIGPVLGVSDERLRAQYETNVFGLLGVTRAFTPAMMSRGSGKIINVSSVGGRVTTPFMGVYTSTKFALESLSDAMRVELAPFGVQVVVIEPGYINTNFTGTALDSLSAASAGTPWEGMASQVDSVLARFEATASKPEAVTSVIEKVIAARSPRARYIAPWWNVFSLLILWVPTGLADAAITRLLGMGKIASTLSKPQAA